MWSLFISFDASSLCSCLTLCWRTGGLSGTQRRRLGGGRDRERPTEGGVEWFLSSEPRIRQRAGEYDDSIQHTAKPRSTTSPSSPGQGGRRGGFWGRNIVSSEISPHHRVFGGEPSQAVSSSDHEVSFLRVSRCDCLMNGRTAVCRGACTLRPSLPFGLIIVTSKWTNWPSFANACRRYPGFRKRWIDFKSD